MMAHGPEILLSCFADDHCTFHTRSPGLLAQESTFLQHLGRKCTSSSAFPAFICSYLVTCAILKAAASLISDIAAQALNVQRCQR